MKILLDERALSGLASTMASCVLKIAEQKPNDKFNGYRIYWTEVGLLLWGQATSTVFVHNNGTGFLMRGFRTYGDNLKEVENLAVGVLKPAPAEPDLSLTLIDVVCGLAKRSLLKEEEVPKCSRLRQVAKAHYEVLGPAIESEELELWTVISL